MGFTFSIDVPKQLVLGRGWGTVTVADAREHDRRLRLDPSFRPDCRQLLDLRDVTTLAFSHAEIQQIAIASLFSPGVKRALVAGSDATFGICRMLAAYAEGAGQSIAVFRDMAAAERWIGLPGSSAEQRRRPLPSMPGVEAHP